MAPATPVKLVTDAIGSLADVSDDWVHEIKHDGYRMIVHRDGPTVRLSSRNAYDWTERLAAIANAVESIKAKSFTIDGEAVSRMPALSSRSSCANAAVRSRNGLSRKRQRARR